MTSSGPTASWVVENGALKMTWSPFPSLTAQDPDVQPPTARPRRAPSGAAGCVSSRSGQGPPAGVRWLIPPDLLAQEAEPREVIAGSLAAAPLTRGR